MKDAWRPFAALLEVMSAHIWIFPTGWALTILLHWLTVGAEVERQRRELSAIRKVRTHSKRH